jgi:hypothetical protein
LAVAGKVGKVEEVMMLSFSASKRYVFNLSGLSLIQA